MAVSKVAGLLLAGTVTVGALSTVAVTNSDNIFDGVTDMKEKVVQLWDNQEVLKGIISDKNKTIKEKVAEANDIINGKLAEIDTLNTQIESKASQIAQLEADLETANGETSEAEAQLQQAKDDKARLEAELQALSDYVDQVEQELADAGITDETVTNVDATEFKLSQEEMEIEDGTPPTLEEQIDDYLTTQANYDKLTAYSVELINGDYVVVEVVIDDANGDGVIDELDNDSNGTKHASVNYIIDEGASIDPNAIIGMDTTTTLAKYIGDQATDVSNEFGIVVDQIRFQTEAGTNFAYWSASSQGIKTTNYNN